MNPEAAGLPPRLVAALADRYRLERRVGEGGMATVYLVDDLKHDRRVALKVLKPELAAVVGAERFLTEIRTTATLQHPHILPLFNSGQGDGFLYYVMPFIEGESLRERLDREKQLPVDEAVRIATDVAEALDHAHRHGVVHRDVKPANILLSDGRPLVADFGIALAVSAAGGGRLTETGLSLGTPYYMSPEQATGDRDPDARSDVYALGAVLYEMLVGEPPHGGTTAHAVLARILTGEVRPPLEQRASIPKHVDAAVRRALQRLPADRFGSAAELARALRNPEFRFGAEPGRDADDPGAAGRWRAAAAVLAGIALVTLIGLVWALARPAPETSTPRVVRATLELPPTIELALEPPAFTPDGDGLVVSVEVEGESALAQWDLGSGTVALLPSGPGDFPFVSPDGDLVGFTREGAYWRAPLEGGPIVQLAAAPGFFGGDWGSDGWVYLSPDYTGGLVRVRGEGGAVEPVTSFDPAGRFLGHWWPQLLPGGEHVLFTAYRGPMESEIQVVSLGTGEVATLVEGGLTGRYVPSGHLLYARGDVLFAAPFDLATLEVTGTPQPVVSDLFVESVYGMAAYAVSTDGTLAYLRSSQGYRPTEIVRVDRSSGSLSPIGLPRATYHSPSLSPDEGSLALEFKPDGEAWDILVVDIESGTHAARLTRGGGSDVQPVWTPDGSAVLFSCERLSWQICRRVANGSRPIDTLFVSELDKHPRSFTADGASSVIEETGTPQGSRFLVLPLDGGAPPDTLHVPGSNIGGPMLSPDGRWLLYTSSETGENEVWATTLDGSGVRHRISTEGGMDPMWTRGGREIVYRDVPAVLAVTFDPGTGARGRPVELFRGEYIDYVVSTGPAWDVSADGETFYMVRETGEPPRRISIITNFFEVLRSRGEASR